MNLHAELIRFAMRHAGLVAMQFRFVRHVVHEDVLLLRARFGLIRDLSVRRIDNTVAGACITAKSRNRSTAAARRRSASCRSTTRSTPWSTTTSRCTAARTSTRHAPAQVQYR